MMKPWYMSKTIWINLLLLVLAIISAIMNQTPEYMRDLAITSSVINVILRFVTVDPIGIFHDDE